MLHPENVGIIDVQRLEDVKRGIYMIVCCPCLNYLFQHADLSNFLFVDGISLLYVHDCS